MLCALHWLSLESLIFRFLSLVRRAWIVYVGKDRSLSFLGGDCSVEHFAVRLLLLDFAWALVAALSDYAPEWDEDILYHLTVHFVSLLPPEKGQTGRIDLHRRPPS